VDAKYKTGKAIAGGIDHTGLLISGSPAEVTAAAKKAISESGGGKFILTPGCSVDLDKIPESNLKALRASVE
jgi:uroporphyrinogen decarboxylase